MNMGNNPGSGNQAHDAGIDPRPLSELRLTEEEFVQYKKDSHMGDTYKTFGGEGRRKLRVIGYNEDTKSVLRASNTKGDDYIEVPWSEMDSLLWIGQRIEEKIRVSIHHWVLASSEGVIFKTFGELVGSSSAFRTKGQVVLTLLMPFDLPEFVRSNVKMHAWRKTTPTAAAMFSDARAKCIAEFGMVDPVVSTDWTAYLAQRKSADKRLRDELKDFAGEDRPDIYEQIESGIEAVLDCTDMSEPIMHDCVVPLSVDVTDDGWGNVSTAEILTRIYSPRCPSAVDVFLSYHYRTRYESVEYYCSIYYRAHSKVSSDLKPTYPRGPRTLNGFKSLVEMGFADVPPGRRWRAVEERNFEISKGQVYALHTMMFGEPQKKKKEAESDEGDVDIDATSMAHVDMVRLMLASVGILLDVADVEDGEDAEDALDSNNGLTWEGLGGCDRWLGRNIRRVCGARPLEGDGNDTDKDEDEGEDDEDDDDDEYGRARGEPDCRNQ